MKLRENTIRTERHYVFGMDSAQVNRLCIGLKKNPFIKKLGVHFHRKTQNTSEWNLVGEFSELVSEEALACISIVNIGGGLPVLYKNTTDKAVPCAFERIEEFKEYLSERRVELIIEPGRFISAPAVKLEAKILLVHDNTIVVDASVYNSSIDTLIVPVKLLVEGELPDSAEQKGNPYLIKGITPCSTDLFRYRVYLKQAPRKGDALLFLNAGSYNFHTEFCELEKIKTVLVD
jgi:ornithine decarboxylase